VYKAMFSR